MLKREITKILESSRSFGWVLEPDAKRVLALSGLDVPRFKWIREEKEAGRLPEAMRPPLVAKVVSPQVLHKSELSGVEMGIENGRHLKKAFDRFKAIEGFSGILVEEMVPGVELIVGAKIDEQFGPVILLGLGGTAVEIYQDTAVRMAPLQEKDVESMIGTLKARELLGGYRGAEPVDHGKLTRMLMAFSKLVMQLQDEIQSVDLNPVRCSSSRCVVADARIILKK